MGQKLKERHVTETTLMATKRAFSGENECEELLDWLNSNESTPEKGRVIAIIETFQSLSEGWVVERSGDGKPMALFKGGDYVSMVKRMKRQLSRYKYHPFFLTTRSITTLTWSPAGRVKCSPYLLDGWALDYDEFRAVFDLAQLAGRELLDRLKRCRCGRWFFARFAHQRFHTSKCREQEFRSTPKWKEHRRKKAREYYWLHKSGKVK